MDLLRDLHTNETWFKDSKGIVDEDDGEDEDDDDHGCISPISIAGSHSVSNFLSLDYFVTVY